MYRKLITGFLLLAGSFSANALDFVPRVGADIAQQEYVYLDNVNNAVKQDVAGGVNAGLLMVGNKVFLDFSIETINSFVLANDDNTYVKGYRTELSATIGYRFWERIWLTAGYQNLYYGSSILGKDKGEMYAPKVGFSMTNMQQGDYLFTVGFAWALGIKSRNISFA